MSKSTEKIKKAVLPVAGYGTRFFPLTRAQPKEMLPIMNKPVVQYIVEECVDSGIEEIIFITGRHKRAIEDHFDYLEEIEDVLVKKGMFEELQEFENLRKKINLIFVRQDRQLGNGHALMCAAHLLKDGEPFVFCNADDLIVSNFPAIKQMIKEYEKNQIVEELIAVMEIKPENLGKYGVVKPMYNIDKDKKIFQVEKIIEKPEFKQAPSNLANPGRYILTKDIFKALNDTSRGHGGEIWISDAFNKMGEFKSIYGCIVEGKRYDCGDRLDYLKAVIDYAKKDPDIKKQFNRWLKK
ncbi:MAG: NTP transferase domain-containing protein [Candidatus Moranbacteria bacterium]|nr:NTP transferase domain-containing protein [Candidatus Moranbacteria bacterium]